MKAITITAPSAHYRALVGPGLLKLVGPEVAKLLPKTTCAVVADDTTARLFADTVLRSLAEASFAPTLICLPPGEGAKSLEQAGRLCDEMAAAKLDRSSFVVALGGGVVGDLAGFAAAIYHRGIPHVQLPTTLLAQVDSSIGGKTAVNTQTGKNLLGAIHQPALVLADVETLATLPPREFKQGFAEIIKHGIIADPGMFEVLERFHREELTDLIARNIEIKAAIVAADERDASGQRAVLNFGHTVGHAIEHAAGYGTMLHGEVVSLGIVAACDVSMRTAGLAQADRDRVVAMLQRFHLPTRLPPNIPRDEIFTAIAADKKFEQGQVRFIVTPRLGSARVANDVTLEDIAAAIESV